MNGDILSRINSKTTTQKPIFFSRRLIFMGINMSIMDGVTATKQIRNICPESMKVFVCCI